MFDRYIMSPPRTEYVTREVHEHRAPTDESVKLLREMEQAADAKRIACMKIDGNVFKGHAEIIRNLAQGYQICAIAVFDLNGKRCTATTSVDECMDGSHKVELVQALHAEVSRLIASEILEDAIRGIRW